MTSSRITRLSALAYLEDLEDRILYGALSASEIASAAVEARDFYLAALHAEVATKAALRALLSIEASVVEVLEARPVRFSDGGFFPVGAVFAHEGI